MAGTEERPSVRRKVSAGVELGPTVFELKVGSGNDATTFTVHANLLVKQSDYFKALENSNWSESNSHHVDLDDADPALFGIFSKFLHTGTICSIAEEAVGSIHDYEWDRLGEAWTLGDRLQSTSFKDAIVDALTAKLAADMPSVPAGVQYMVYQSGNQSSAVRRLIVDIAVKYWDDDWFRDENMTLKADVCFRHDLLYALARARIGGKPETLPDPAEQNGCEYHEHTTAGTACYKEMF